MCKNTAQNLWKKHSPANPDFSLPFVIFRSNPKLNNAASPQAPSVGTEAGQEALCSLCAHQEGLYLDAWIFAVCFLYFNICKMTTTETAFQMC